MFVSGPSRRSGHLSTDPRAGLEGFTIVELLVSAAVVLCVMGVALVVVGHARDALDRDGMGVESAQRLRAGLDALARDVRSAGAGPEADRAPVSLAHALPVVELLRPAGMGGDTEGFQALRVTSAPRGAAHGRLADAVTGGSVLRLEPSPACPALPACGFQPDMAIAIYDGSGVFDLATVRSVDGVPSITLEPPLPHAYAAGSIVTEIASTMFELEKGADGSARLMRRTAGAAQPVVDAVVAFAIAAFGDAMPPLPGRGPRSPPTYGPSPPLAGTDDPRDAWPAGENCAMTLDADGRPAPRLPVLGTPGELVPVQPTQLDDGPWCPAAAGGAYDADLYRLRRLDFRLRVESAAARLRGPAGTLFTRSGHGRPATWVPDLELRMSLTLPNTSPR